MHTKYEPLTKVEARLVELAYARKAELERLGQQEWVESVGPILELRGLRTGKFERDAEGKLVLAIEVPDSPPQLELV